MKALMLAAGVGRRLYGDENDELPKALLRFDGESLLARHIKFLVEFGVDELVMVVGHRKNDLLAEAMSVAPPGFIRAIENTRYKEGPVISLSLGESVLKSGDSVLFMDADVLYHPVVLERLIRSEHRTCFIVDRDFEPGEEPVKLCIRDGLVVDFGKQVSEPHDTVGEWPGFFKMAPEIAARIADSALEYVARNEVEGAYEDSMCDVLKSEPPGTFGYEDVTGLPWIEIDFPSDLIRAERIILPRVSEPVIESYGSGTKVSGG